MNWQAFRLRALWCWHQLLTLGLLGVVVVAILVGISRQLLPLADRYRPEVEAALSARIGLPVTLQRLEGEVDGTQLRLRLLQLQLHDPAARDKVLLEVPAVELRPAVWQSLRHLEVRVDVRLQGLDIHLDQQPDGSLQLRELAGLARRDAGTAEQSVRFVLRQPVLALSESRVSLNLQKFPALELSSVELVNRNEGERHRLAGRVRMPGVASDFALQLELEGDPLRWQQSRVRLWANLPALDLDSWLTALPESGIDIARLRGGGSYWLDFQQGHLASLQAQIDWPELELQRAGKEHRFSDLRGVLSWRRHGAGWQLAAEHLQGNVDGYPWPVPQLAVRASPELTSVALAEADIGVAAKLLPALPLPEHVAAWFREAAPSGQLTSLRADLLPQPGQGWRLQLLDTEIRRLNASATEAFPGGRNLSGWLRWTPDRLWLGLDSRVAQLDEPKVLAEPLLLHALQCRLRMTREAGAWRLDSDLVQLANADLKARGVFSALLTPGDPLLTRVSVLGSVSDARAASVWRYLPRAAGERAAEWLHQSLRGGTVPRADFAYEGRLHPDPELDPARLLMHVALQDGRVDYAPGWPEVRNLDAAIVLDDHRLDLEASGARLLDGTHARAVRASVADLHEPVFELSAEVDGNGADLMRLFRDSPLEERLPGLTDTLALSGPLQGGLSLALPLHGGPLQFATTIRLDNNQLDLKTAGLSATALRGEVSYSTGQGLQSSRLDAELLEAPVQADIQTRPGPHPETVVNLTGQVEVGALRRWLASSLLDMASGSTPYQARVTLPADAPPRLQLDTSLGGLRIKLPAPLGKSAQDAVPLRYQTALGGAEQIARFQYGQLMSGGLVWQGNHLSRALLRLDSTTPAWPQQPGIEVEGRMARLDMAEWKPWLSFFQRVGKSGTVAARGQTPLPGLTRLSLDTKELLAEGWRLRNAHVGLLRDSNQWRLALDSDELAGTALVPDAPTSEISLGFSRLQLPLPGANGKKDANKETSDAGLNPVAGLGNRPLLIRGEGLRLAAWPGLGPMGVEARVLPLPYGLRVEDITLQSPVLNFAGRLDWQWRGGVSTHLQGKAGSTNVAGLLAAFGQAPGVVGRRANADVDLSWHGAPDRATPAALDGQLNLTLEEGRLLNISTGTSISRVFGWFDFDNIRRRLRGDFSDVVRRGLVFDRITLEGPLQAGVMQPATFAVSGPTLQAKGEGRIDLGQKKLDQQLTVTVPVTSAVPIAAVVVAGPLVGGAVAAAKMAFDKQIDKVTQLHYHVSGSWANPQVDRISSPKAPVEQATASRAGGAPAVGPTAPGGH